MKIAMLSPYSLSRPGGVQGQVFGLSRALRKLGHEVTVIGPQDEGATVADDERGRGGSTHRPALQRVGGARDHLAHGVRAHGAVRAAQ